jgi:hypothetical protein
MTYLTDREIHIVGVQRTGQHAITSWLIGHFGDVLYKNCMSQLGRTRGRMKGIELPFWYFKDGEEGYTETNEFIPTKDAIILGTEFTVYKVGLNPNLEKEKKALCKSHKVDQFSKRRDNILVIRNPYNQYASVLNWGKNKMLSPTKSFSRMWVLMAKECAGETENIQDRTTLIYDDWFEHSDYRRRIEEQLDLKRDDSRLNTVMKVGHGRSWGSSFDGMKTKKEAQKMDVLNRWKTVKDDQRFIDLCKNEELVEWAEEYGWSCPL